MNLLKPWALTLALSSTVFAAEEAGWSSENFKDWPSPVNPEAIVTEGGTEIRWMPVPLRILSREIRFLHRL